MKITGYSRFRLASQIVQYRKTGQVEIKGHDRQKFEKKYNNKDIQLLAKTDHCHASPNGAALKKILEGMVRQCGKEESLKLSHSSVSPVYNLKKKVSCRHSNTSYQKTNKGKTIGQRCKPQLEERPGYLRVDTVHQGNQKRQQGNIPYQSCR